MTLSELKETIIYIIKRDTYCNRALAERIADNILLILEEYIKGGNEND